VRDSNGNQLDTFPSAMGTMTRLACARAKQKGVEVDLLLRKAGLTYHQIDDTRARLAVKSQSARSDPHRHGWLRLGPTRRRTNRGDLAG
jgi:hypothetical protein